jgi:hypothetical protein
MSWVIPDSPDSDHPGSGSDSGPSWVASIVNAIGRKPILEFDGNYHRVGRLGRLLRSRRAARSGSSVATTQGGPGFRVPMIVVSPYARLNQSSQPGYISNVVYSFGSIIRFVEDTFDLGRLGTTDETTNSLGPEYGSQGGDMFNFNQSPRQFQAIGSKYSRSHFLHRKPSNQPVDTE